jgi:iron complex outermembrane receptor protein
LAEGLEYKFLYAINHGSGVRNTNIDGWLEGIQGVSGLGVGVISRAILTSQTYTHTLNYNKSLSDNLSLSAVGGYEYWKTNYSNSSAFASQFNTNLDQSTGSLFLTRAFFKMLKHSSPYQPS